MTGCANREHAETVGLGPSIISVAQPWPVLPAQMERFLELTFLLVALDEAQVTECWRPDEVVKQEPMALEFPEGALWMRQELGKRMCSLGSNRIT